MKDIKTEKGLYSKKYNEIKNLKKFRRKNKESAGRTKKHFNISKI
jgi:hypothetical protein